MGGESIGRLSASIVLDSTNMETIGMCVKYVMKLVLSVRLAAALAADRGRSRQCRAVSNAAAPLSVITTHKQSSNLVRILAIEVRISQREKTNLTSLKQTQKVIHVPYVK